MNDAQYLAELERELEQLQKQLPKHGLKSSMLTRIDELEEEIAELKKKLGESK
ncbi:MAG: histidine kinase [Chloroflexi bacterium]|nr:histidine kinase [Chloroflexota bacterium]